MSEVATQDQPSRIGADKIILGLLVLVVVGALIFVSGQRQQALRKSPSGFDGLQIWLAQDQHEVQSFAGGWPVNVADLAMQIIPVYDTMLGERRIPPDNKEAFLFQQDEYDLDDAIIREKASQVATLVVLPKWRSGMRLTGLAHPALLNEQERISQAASALVAGSDVHAVYSAQPFTKFSYETGDGGLEVVLYAAQMLAAPQCTPIVGKQDLMVLGVCPLPGEEGKTVYILSDPDLLNNHGLRLGDNAAMVRDWVRRTATDGRIMIDYSRANWLTEEVARSTRERTWSDLMRFFAPPFTAMWAGFVLVCGLCLWRAGIRFGPALVGSKGMGASKMLAIGARAKLMRLANRDGALTEEYAKARLAATATVLFGGAQATQFARPDAFVAYVQRRHPNHATALSDALDRISTLPAQASSSQAMSSIAALDRILETIIHDT